MRRTSYRYPLPSPRRPATRRHLPITLLLGGYLLGGPAGAALNHGDIRLHSTLQQMQMSGRQAGGACLPGYRWHPIHGGCRSTQPETDREQADCPAGHTGHRWRTRTRLVHTLQADRQQVARDAWQPWQGWNDAACLPIADTRPPETPPGTGPGNGDGDNSTKPPPPKTRQDSAHYVEIALVPQISGIWSHEVYGLCVPLSLFARIDYTYRWAGQTVGLKQLISETIHRSLAGDGAHPALLSLDLSNPQAELVRDAVHYRADLSGLGAAVRQQLGVSISQVTDPLLNHCTVIGLTVPFVFQVPITRWVTP